MAYSDKVIDHYENPRNVGTFDKNDESVGTSMVGAPTCGDVMRLQIKVNDEGIIEDAKFKTYGCGSAIASSSLITEWVKGKSLDDALAIKNSEIAEELELPPVKIHCSILAEDAVKRPLPTTANVRKTDKAFQTASSRNAVRTTRRFRSVRAVQQGRNMITLTENAAKHINDYLAKRGKGLGVRLGVKTSGCSGMAYNLEFVDEADGDDLIFEGHGAHLYRSEKPGLSGRHASRLHQRRFAGRFQI